MAINSFPIETTTVDVDANTAEIAELRIEVDQLKDSALESNNTLSETSRENFVVSVAAGEYDTHTDGTEVRADGLSYIKQSGATSISDLPDFVAGGRPSPQHFGAIGDGVTDDTDAVRSFFQSHKSFTANDGDVFRITDRIIVTMDGQDVRFTGGRFIFDMPSSTVAGFQIRSELDAGRQTVYMNNTIFLTRNSNCIRGVLLDWIEVPTTLGNERHYMAANFHACQFVPEDTNDQSHRFGNCVEVKDKTNINFTDCLFTGPKSASGLPYEPFVFGTTGVEITGDNSPVEIKFTTCTMRHIEYGVRLGVACEGISFNDPQMNAVRIGVLQSYIDPISPAYENLGFFIRGGHINATTSCVDIRGAAEVVISDMEFYGKADREGEVAQDWAGVRLALTEGAVRDFTIHGCTFSGPTTDTQTNVAIGIGNADIGRITNNRAQLVEEFLDVSNVSLPRKQIFVKDNIWREFGATFDLADLSSQSSDNTKVYAAWSF